MVNNLKEYFTIHCNCSESNFKKKFPYVYSELMERTKFLPDNYGFSSRKYVILNDLCENDLKCPICGGFKKFVLKPYMKFLDTCGSKQCQIELCSKTNKRMWREDRQSMYEKHSKRLVEYNKNLTNEQKRSIHAKISNALKSLPPEKEQNRIRKGFQTKKIRNSFNKSVQEDYIFERLTQKFDIVHRQYLSEEYPWHIDFYIPSLNLYIEYQGLWTHGKMPFENNEECDKILKTWMNKAKHSMFYKNAIKVWTITDVKKRTYAKDNNLNWKEFFNLTEFDNWIENI